MIREFVKAFKKMGDLTNHMKYYMSREVDALNNILERKDKDIKEGQE